MKLRPLLAALAASAASLTAADPAPGGPERLTELWESNGSRREFLESLRLIKQAGPRNGAVRVFEALIALSDGRALEASEYAALAAAAPGFDFGDCEGIDRALDAGLAPPEHPLRNRACAELVEFLLSWGEEWDWRGKPAKAREAWQAAATLAAQFEIAAPRPQWALRWSNLRYRARHRLAGLALRSGDPERFQAECALGAEAHAARTALAAAPEPVSAEEWRTAIESGYRALLLSPIEPPDHALAALADAPELFGTHSPAALTVVALENRLRDRALPLRYDAALALLPHAAAVRDALRA
ncbi:MAG: hypothetical protein HUU15_06705, partial [Candidatus Brocadiae bacterium]|nr:hypothetical protein [Candidatus Brocadiia bacterium]